MSIVLWNIRSQSEMLRRKKMSVKKTLLEDRYLPAYIANFACGPCSK